MSRSKFKLTTEEQAADPLQEAAPSESDAALFGDADLPPAGRMVARPIIIRNIWPDRTQPRKAVPLKIAGEWDGDPARVADVLEHWRQEAERVSGQAIDILKYLERPGEGSQDEAARNPEYVGFLALVNLAASIKRYGLTNPITVFKDGTRFRIETGERRWLAYHLLYQALGEPYASIPAREVDYDIWRQSTENTAREDLNAIAQARQLAKLLLDLHWQTDGADFQSYEELVLPGGCDRRYYAQVANGNVYRIPSGMGQRILNATGFPSLRMLSAYRKLLKPTDDDDFNDELWMQADLEDWPEARIRAHVDDWKAEQARAAGTLPIGKVADGPQHETGASGTDFEGAGRFYDLPPGDDDREFAEVGRTRSEPFPGRAAAPAEEPDRAVGDPQTRFNPGDKVRLTRDLGDDLRAGTLGTVVKSGGVKCVDFEGRRWFSRTTHIDGEQRDVLEFCELVAGKPPDTPDKQDETPVELPDSSLLASETTLAVLRVLRSLAAVLSDSRADTALQELAAVDEVAMGRLATRLDDGMMRETLGQYHQAIETLLVHANEHVLDLLERMREIGWEERE